MDGHLTLAADAESRMETRAKYQPRCFPLGTIRDPSNVPPIAHIWVLKSLFYKEAQVGSRTVGPRQAVIIVRVFVDGLLRLTQGISLLQQLRSDG